MDTAIKPTGFGQYMVNPAIEEGELRPTAESIVPQPDLSSDEPVEPEVTGLAKYAVGDALKPQLTKQDIIDSPEKMAAIREAAIARWGTDYQDKPDDEVVDDFVSHMRWVNSNDFALAGEASAFWGADDKGRAAIGNGYKVYEELGGVLVNDDAWGATKGIATYAAGTLLSPSTYIGGFIGKGASAIAARSATKAAQKKAMATAIQAATKTVVKGAAKSAPNRSAITATAMQARRELVTNAVKTNVKAKVIGATVTDAATGVAQNLVYQDMMIESGVQEDRNYWEAGAVALLGGVGGAVSYIPHGAKGVSGLTDTGAKISAAKAARAGKVAKAAAPEIEKMMKRLSTNWKEMAARGESVNPNLELRTTAVEMFFDIENENSLVRILQRAGANFDFDNNITLSQQMVGFARALPKDVQDSLNKSFEPFGTSFPEIMDIFASVMRKAGQDQSSASIAKKFLQEYANMSVAKKNSQRDTIVGAFKAENEVVDAATQKRVFSYTTSLWKRMLTSTPATTMANVKGYGYAMAARSMAEMLYGGVVGTQGLVARMLGSTTADYKLAQSSAMFKSQWFMAKTLLDPYTTVESFMELLSNAGSRTQKKALGSFFGGVDEGVPALYGLSKDSFFTRNAEKVANVAANLSLVKVQDLYTKSFSGIKQLDIESRKSFGMGISDLINANRTHELTDEMWDRSINAMLRDTFSQDYTKGGNLAEVAKIIEVISNNPVAGLVIPFGRFMNNTMAFISAYSPIGLLPVMSKAFRVKGAEQDVGMMLAKATVGSMAIGYAVYNESGKMKEGLQWFEERDETGEVVNISNVFPRSVYNLVGRIGAIMADEGGVPADLLKEFKKQVGPLDVLANIGDNDVVTDFVKFLGQTSEEDAAYKTAWDAILYAAESISGTVLSGFTRPLDPLDKVAGIYGEAYGDLANVSVDRKQAEGLDAVMLGLSRYTNTVFSLIAGDEIKEGGRLYGSPAYSSTQEGPKKDPNPVSSIFGRKVEPRRTNIDKVLGMANLPPFRADSFTTGIPEYDAFMNDTVYPTLERKATNLLNGPTFKNASAAKKLDMVNAIIKDARYEILDAIEHNYVGDPNAMLLNERRKLMAYDQSLRAEAKNALGITQDDRKLNLYQVQLIRDWINLERETRKNEIDQY